ncbi:hypothetical protein ACFL1B_01835 [Nanoarchaeota archaeon]
MEDDFIYKEAIVLILIVIFSMGFYFNVMNPALHISFIIASIAFYMICIYEEKKAGKNKKMHDYFKHQSSYFALAGLFFVISYLIMQRGFVLVTLAVAIILFSTGFMHLLFSRLK